MTGAKDSSDFANTANNAEFFMVWRNKQGDIVLKATGKAISTEALGLAEKISATDIVIRDANVVPDRVVRDRYKAALLGIAKVGLEWGKLEVALAALDSFKRRVTTLEGPHIRHKHITSTLKISGGAAIISFIIGLFIPHIESNIPEFLSEELSLLKTAVWLLSGNSLGIVFFSYIRNLEFSFSKLQKFDPSRLSPILRLIMVYVTTAIFSIFLSTGVVQFGIGGNLLNKFFENGVPNPQICLLVGILAGYVDSKIVSVLTKTMAGGDEVASNER